MPRKTSETTRFGIGEWYGHRITAIPSLEKARYATITSTKTEPCPHRPGSDRCNKNGGVCSLAVYRKKEHDGAILDSANPDLITLCPMRFWQGFTIFKEVGRRILQTETPTLIKEIGFLQSIDNKGSVMGNTVGRIDMVLADTDSQDRIKNWCALEMQAIYFSGQGMKTEFQAIAAQPNKLLFPTAIRRPDFRSSGPKRLMPQLQIKVPSLRRWGKTMAVVIDNSFFETIAPMKRSSDISNADIAWLVVNYDGPEGELRVSEVVLTTLESSVEGLTAGEPITREEFEKELASYLAKREDKVIRLS
jgi:hypothetical protein